MGHVATGVAPEQPCVESFSLFVVHKGPMTVLGASWLFHAHLQLVNYKLEAIGLPMSSWVQAEALGWAGELPWPQLSPRAKQVPSAALPASPKHCISIKHEKNPPDWLAWPLSTA